jgi:hypothetical protein
MGFDHGPARHPLRLRQPRPARAADHSIDVQAGSGCICPRSARLGLSRETIGFVSSNGWDVAGAKAFGSHVAA